MSAITIEILIILLLLAANGLFAMTEIAVVSARKTRLRQLADRLERAVEGSRAHASAIEINRKRALRRRGSVLLGHAHQMVPRPGGRLLAEEAVGESAIVRVLRSRLVEWSQLGSSGLPADNHRLASF